jgi:co-chaperonin GroES (HSP10)
MSIKPAGHRILVKQTDLHESDNVYKTARAAGLEIVQDRGVKAQESVDTGVVVEIGPTAWKDFGGTPWCVVGDNVVFAKFAGKKVDDPEDKENIYVVLNDEDIVAVVKG